MLTPSLSDLRLRRRSSIARAGKESVIETGAASYNTSARFSSVVLPSTTPTKPSDLAGGMCSGNTPYSSTDTDPASFVDPIDRLEDLAYMDHQCTRLCEHCERYRWWRFEWLRTGWERFFTPTRSTQLRVRLTRILVHLPLILFLFGVLLLVVYIIVIPESLHSSYPLPPTDSQGSNLPDTHSLDASGACGVAPKGMWVRLDGSVTWIRSIESGSSGYVVMRVQTSRCSSGTALLHARTALNVVYADKKGLLEGDPAMCLQRVTAETAEVYEGVCIKSDG